MSDRSARRDAESSARVWRGVQHVYGAEFSTFMAQAGPALLRTAWLLTGDHHRAQ